MTTGAPSTSRSAAQAKARGRLRVYLGAAPGVGKTVDMLCEGRRRASRGTDVVVGIVEFHGRDYTAAQVGDLPVVPRRVMNHRGVRLSEMDTDAVLVPAPGRGPGRRARAYQRARIVASEALAGRRATTRRRYRRDHDGERPAPGIPQRRGRGNHRCEAVRDRARFCCPGGRADRTGRYDAAGAASTDGARAHLPGGPDRHRAGQLLSGGKPHRAAGARAALGGRPGRGGTGPLPRRAWNQGHLGGPRPDRGRADRRSRGVDAAPARRPDRRSGRRQVVDRRARRALRRHGDVGDRDRTTAAARREPGRQPATHRRRRHRCDRVGVRQVCQRHSDHRRRFPARTPGAVVPAERGQRHRDGLRRYRCLYGHPSPRCAITSAEDAERGSAWLSLVVGGSGPAADRVGRVAVAVA